MTDQGDLRHHEKLIFNWFLDLPRVIGKKKNNQDNCICLLVFYTHGLFLLCGPCLSKKNNSFLPTGEQWRTIKIYKPLPSIHVELNRGRAAIEGNIQLKTKLNVKCRAESHESHFLLKHSTVSGSVSACHLCRGGQAVQLPINRSFKVGVGETSWHVIPDRTQRSTLSYHFISPAFVSYFIFCFFFTRSLSMYLLDQLRKLCSSPPYSRGVSQMVWLFLMTSCENHAWWLTSVPRFGTWTCQDRYEAPNQRN